MVIDLRSKLSKSQSHSKSVEPIELFETLAIRSKDVKELWRTQADALREWHENRASSDILFILNTGAGKTLIGLLAAASLVNETRGKVLYVCATNQLIEQTKSKATEYGIPVSTYYSHGWSGDAFERGIGPCITNYQAVLNGKSIFNRENINAVIFDDSHTAYTIVQEQYTLNINVHEFPKAYNEIIELIKEYFQSVNRHQRFFDVMEGTDPHSVLFVPTFLMNEISNEIRSILVSNGVQDSSNTLFVWEHLKDKLKYCSLFIDTYDIQIVPPLPPIHNQKCFSDNVRRLYLSATISSQLAFCRTFGQLPDKVIQPGGRAGDCERLILPSPQDISDSDARQWAKETIKDKKVLIMVPSKPSATPWKDVADIFESSDGHARVRKFAQSFDEKLVLVGRYDGIDLPGDDCRILIIDGLPTGISHQERFFEQHLNVSGLTNSLVSSRITQMFGRISRGMTDYGSVILLGKKLNRWLNDPRNRSLLPIHIQKQLQIGDAIAEQYNEDITLELLLNKCLNREEDWMDIYEDGMNNPTLESKQEDNPEDSNEIALLERKFIEKIWMDEPDQALKPLYKLINLVEPNLKAWYLHWLGYCLLLVNEQDSLKFFLDAARMKSELGRPIEHVKEMLDTGKDVSEQAKIIAERLKIQGSKTLGDLDQTKRYLINGSSSNQVEEGIKRLGHWLGFSSVRPDNDLKTGPDNLWITSGKSTVFIIECKTNKESNSNYTKDEIGQYHQHIQWTKNEYPDANQIRIIIGPTTGVTKSATPPEDLWAVSLESFYNIANVLHAAYKNVLDEGMDIFFISRVQDAIDKERLTYENIFNSLEKVCISDLLEI